MTFLTIESLRSSLDHALRKMLSSKRGFIVCESTINYDDVSSIFSAISSFASLKTDTSDSVFVFPLSIIQLSRSEYFDVAMDLIRALGISDDDQLIVCIDGDPNDVLFEQFEHDDVLMTLEEIRALRELVNSEENDVRTFGKNCRFVHTTEDEMHALFSSVI